MRGWGSRRPWPPPPCVEDEEDSLAHELADGSTTVSKSDDDAQSRGAIDQYPIILNAEQAHAKHVRPKGVRNDSASISSQSSDESAGPATPPSSTEDRLRSRTPVPSAKFSNRENIFVQSNQDHKHDERRGRERPTVAQLETGVDPEIELMLSGRRRAPSPYRMVKPEREESAAGKSRFLGESLLSPETVTSQPKRPDASKRRPSSARPLKERTADQNSSEETERKTHHTRRSSRASFSTSTRPDVVEDRQRVEDRDYENSHHVKKRDHHSDKRHSRSKVESPHTSSAEETKHRHRDRSRVRERHGDRSPRPSISNNERSDLSDTGIRGAREPQNRKVEEQPDDFQRPRRQATLEIPGASDDSKRQHRERSRTRDRSRTRHDEPERHSSKLGLPNDSSTEEPKHRSRDRSRVRERNEGRSPRPSFSNVQRPTIDTRISYVPVNASPVVDDREERRRKRQDSEVSRQDYANPRPSRQDSIASGVSPVTPDWDKAFRDNRNKRIPTPLSSAVASAQDSPDQTPPRTPRASKPPPEFFASSAAGVSGQVSSPKVRNASRSGTLDDYTTQSDRVNAPRPPSMLSNSSRSSSDFSATAASDVRSRQSSVVPPAVEPRPVQRTSTYGPQPTESPRTVHRAYSYSTTSDHAHHYEDSTRQRHPQPGTPAAGQRQRPAYSAQPSREQVPRTPSSDMASASLPACPRSKPSAGYYDWYTVSHIPELNFCPSCMQTLGTSRFRDYFVPRHSGNDKQEIACSMSRPWIRLGWIQTIKQRRPNLEILRNLVESQDGTTPCPGKRREIRSWFSMYDPDADSPISAFDACSYCVRSVRAIFPPCKEVFSRRSSSMVQEKICDLDSKSPRFDRYMSLLETATLHADGKRLLKGEMKDLVKDFRQVCQYEDCLGSVPLQGQAWHFIPHLPELTICPECFNTFVWHMKDQPVANLVSRSMQMVPGSDPRSFISCQLYSERMRRVFKEAVLDNNIEHLAKTAKRRCTIEQLLKQKMQLIDQAISRGEDREDELHEVEERWKAIE